MKSLSAIVLEVEKLDKRYHFHMPIGASYGEAYDVAMECAAEIWKMAEDARKKAEDAKEKPSEDKPVN